MTATTKTEAFSELRARLNSGALELYEEPQLLAELRRLRTKYSAGQSSVINPRVGGSHGDMCQALALAVYASQAHPLEPLTPMVRATARLSPDLQHGMWF